MGEHNDYNFFMWHGICLTLAWTLFALIQIASGRYMRGTNWRSHMWIHMISGLLVTAVTVGLSLYALYKCAWYFIKANPHAWAGVITLSCVTVLSLGGFVTRYMLRNLTWNTKIALLTKKVHKIFAYFIILVALVAIWFGIWDYRGDPVHVFE